MQYWQVKIFYNSNDEQLYEQLLAPLSNALAVKNYFAWTVTRDWKSGPHFLLTFCTENYFFSEEVKTLTLKAIVAFLSEFPSKQYDIDGYKRTHAILSKVENVTIESDQLAENNTFQQGYISEMVLAEKLESVLQFKSIFSIQQELSRFIIRNRADRKVSLEKLTFELLMLLATSYPPVPSVDGVFKEYSGFLSYHSNFVFWHHSLEQTQQVQIMDKIETEFQAKKAQYDSWLTQLIDKLGQENSRQSQLSSLLIRYFLTYTQMAKEKDIHCRSPYPREKLAKVDQVSDFHKTFFYDQDGNASGFPTEFSGYRWLLNIIYKILPLLNVSPLGRQAYNYQLSKLYEQNDGKINQLRQQMYLNY
ncbi:hypothetical protein ACFOEE_12075 [Pseudoalteromonas fenneropenaei]|uniref:Uncharacterized protein n=1 Tax=Pseudoalteromonas fenneropenaei TaxID=1737459 RepID=A0ABV7CL30_9GAMM